jgi:hypothetical protein
MGKSWIAPVVILLATVLGLSGCSDLRYRPITYTNVDDMRPGSGLFSGREGAFVVFHDDKSLELRRRSTTDRDSADASPDPTD